MNRPMPPAELLEQLWRPIFTPADDLRDWVFANFIREGGHLKNDDHTHLQDAHIGFLWTNTENTKKGRRIIGQAEEPVFRCGKWQKFRQEMQIMEWFGDVPDFLITLDAMYCQQCSDIEFAALIDHELYHCAQELDEFGDPKFSKDTGRPKYTLAGHDVEEFIGVVRRYGAVSPDVQALVSAAQKAPEVAKVNVARACGTCALKSA